MNDIAVVILNYNGKKYLELFLPTLIKYSQGSRIIVADNKSTDDSLEYLRNNFSDIELIVLEKNHGYAGGYNEALKQIDSKYFLLVNSDIEVTPNWIEPLHKLLESDKNIVSVQPKILSYNNKNFFEHAGAAGGYMDWLGYPFCRGRIFDITEEDKGQYDQREKIFWTTGACFLIRSHSFFEAGMFDSDFFAHMEEIDLCWRLNASGKHLYCEPASVVYHVGGGTLAASNPWKTELNFRNGLVMLLKNLPLVQLLYKLPLRSILDFSASIKFLVDGKPGHSIAVIKAYKQFLLTIRKSIAKRRKLREKTNYSTFKFANKSMVWEHFIKGKKKFSEL